MPGRKRGAASQAAKGATKKKAAATDFAKTRTAARNGKPWKTPTKSVATRALGLLKSADLEATAAKTILARQAVMLADAVEMIHDQSVLKQVELRQVSAMVSAHKQLMTVLAALGIVVDPDDADGLDPLILMGPPPKPKQKPAAKKTAKKKPPAKKKKKKKKRRRTVDSTVDELLGD